ncbi:MAG: pyrroline-5-carboxylate reductase [Novosphingobium sp.]
MTLLIIGCGNMGGAMLDGWLAGGMADSAVTVVDPFREQVPPGVTLLRALPENGAWDFVLLGIKPQQLAEAAPAIAALIVDRTVLLSVLAGVDLDTLARYFPDAGGIVRVMPNLAAALGKSPVALCGTVRVDVRSAVSALMAPLGPAEWIADEGHMDLMTALVGSGPAFVYRVIDALAQGAEMLGLPRSQADRLALAMVNGAAELAAASDASPAELARRVSSPGGTTLAGLSALDENSAILGLMQETLRRARDRGAELAEAARVSN